MTSTENALDPVADIFAGLDARPTPVAVESRPRKVAKLDLSGITSGGPRVEMRRPRYGQQVTTPLLMTSQGTLDALALAVDGRSRRYRQDLEGWARAAMADHAQRGVLVVWDGMFYTITLDPLVPPRTVVETHRRDLAAWRLDQAK